MATAVADGLSGLLADKLSGCVAPEVSESIPIEIEHDLQYYIYLETTLVGLQQYVLNTTPCYYKLKTTYYKARAYKNG